MNRPFDPLHTNGSAMDHAYIETHDVRTRYAMRRLPAHDEQQFEAHLIACAECQDAVQSEMDLRNGLRDVSASAGVATGRRGSTSSAISPTMALAAAASILLAVSAALGVKVARLSSQLNSTTAAVEGANRRSESAERSAAALAARLAEAERAAAAPGPAALAARGVPVSVFALNLTRSAGDANGTPDNRVRIGSGVQRIVLSIDLARPAESAQYLTTLYEEAGRAVVWSGGPYQTSTDTLSMGFDAALFHSGDYVLRLERRTPDGHATPAGQYRFRVTTPSR